MTQAPMKIIVYPDLREKLNELSFKYEKLVWYGRSGVNLDNHAPELKRAVEEARFRVEANYPEDIQEYMESGDWKHGFNSGCLAAFRFALTAFDHSTEICEEDPDQQELCFVLINPELLLLQL